MAKRQVGEQDAELLDRVDARAKDLGQTRAEFVARALHRALTTPTGGETVATISRVHQNSAEAKAGVEPIDRPSASTQAKSGQRLKK